MRMTKHQGYSFVETGKRGSPLNYRSTVHTLVKDINRSYEENSMGPPPTLSRHLGTRLLKTTAAMTVSSSKAIVSQISWLSTAKFNLILHSLNNYWEYLQWHSSEKLISPMWEGSGIKSLMNIREHTWTLVDFRFFGLHTLETLLLVGNFLLHWQNVILCSPGILGSDQTSAPSQTSSHTGHHLVLAP